MSSNPRSTLPHTTPLRQEHTVCSTCHGPTEWEGDNDAEGRAVARPIGQTVRCADCDEWTCGECRSKRDPAYCRACLSCDLCGNDAGDEFVDVIPKTTIGRFDSPELERLCLDCFIQRAWKLAAGSSALARHAFDLISDARARAEAMRTGAPGFLHTAKPLPSCRRYETVWFEESGDSIAVFRGNETPYFARFSLKEHESLERAADRFFDALRGLRGWDAD